MENRVKTLIEEDLKNIIYELFDNEIPPIYSDSTFESLDLDSLDKVEIIVNIEKEYMISIPDNEEENIKTFYDLLSVVFNIVNKSATQTK